MKSKEELLNKLRSIHRKMQAIEADKAHLIEKVMPQHQKSAINLLNYLVFRSENIHILQEELHAHGLSSLASSESHIKAQLCNVLELLGDKPLTINSLNFQEGLSQLKRNTQNLFGHTHHHNISFIL